MDNNELAKRVKELRNRRGLSQELLAENTGLSLRTIQRIENGETTPRGDTLQRLSIALQVSPDEIVDWVVAEDKNFLAALNLSALGFLFFPILGILIPLVMWISKKDKIKGINKTGKELLNFQISWTLVILVTFLYLMGSLFYKLQHAGDISPTIVADHYVIWYSVFGFLYFYNVIFIIINTVKILNEKEVRYLPKIRLIR